MHKTTFEQIVTFSAIVLSAVLIRLIPHSPNIAPIGALALFSGALMPNLVGFAIPLFAMVISDSFLGFHATIPFVYGSFLLITGIGYLIHTKTTTIRVAAASLIGSLLFFVITNFGVWMTSPMYEKSLSGLIRAYMMGLPFFRNTLISDLFYNAVFFGGYSIILHISKQIVLRFKNLVRYHLS